MMTHTQIREQLVFAGIAATSVDLVASNVLGCLTAGGNEAALQANLVTSGVPAPDATRIAPWLFQQWHSPTPNGSPGPRGKRGRMAPVRRMPIWLAILLTVIAVLLVVVLVVLFVVNSSAQTTADKALEKAETSQASTDELAEQTRWNLHLVDDKLDGKAEKSVMNDNTAALAIATSKLADHERRIQAGNARQDDLATAQNELRDAVNTNTANITLNKENIAAVAGHARKWKALDALQADVAQLKERASQPITITAGR